MRLGVKEVDILLLLSPSQNTFVGISTKILSHRSCLLRGNYDRVPHFRVRGEFSRDGPVDIVRKSFTSVWIRSTFLHGNRAIGSPERSRLGGLLLVVTTNLRQDEIPPPTRTSSLPLPDERGHSLFFYLNLYWWVRGV